MKKGKKESTKKLVERLKKEGEIPKDIPFVEDVTEDVIGKQVVIAGRIDGVGVRLSPPIQFQKEKGGEFKIESPLELLDINAKILEGILIARTKKLTKIDEYAEYFNRVISIFNIIGIPFDFVSRSDVVGFLGHDASEKIMEIDFSEKGKRRGRNLPLTAIYPEEITNIIFSHKLIWEKIKEKILPEYGHVYGLLGYSRYYFFQENWFLSFLNGWMFIEAMVELLWRNSMLDKFPTKKQSPIGSSNWTAYVKIDELFMLGVVDDELRRKIQSLREKRNKVFHVDVSHKKRGVNRKDAIQCFAVGLMLLYKVTGLDEIIKGKIIDFRNIRGRMTKKMTEFASGESYIIQEE